MSGNVPSVRGLGTVSGLLSIDLSCLLGSNRSVSLGIVGRPVSLSGCNGKLGGGLGSGVIERGCPRTGVVALLPAGVLAGNRGIVSGLLK